MSIFTVSVYKVKAEEISAEPAAIMQTVQQAVYENTYYPQEMIFDFHLLGVENQGTLSGWSIEGMDITHALYAATYGLQVENYALDKWISFKFNVPAEGDYMVRFSSALAGGGVKADIKVDGSSIAVYDFVSADFIADTGLKDLKVMHLTAGDHIFKLTAIGQTSPSWGYCMYPGKLVLTPALPEPTELSYDFHLLGVENQGTQSGWSIEGMDITHALYAAPYGLQVENYALDKWISFKFNVPAEGDYMVRFSSALAGGGVKADIKVDDSSIAVYDFVSADYVADTGLKDLKVMHLTAGDHIFKLTAIGQTSPSWGYCMYPGKLVLTPSLPVPEELSYDFHKLGAENQETQKGWSIAEKNITHDIYAAPYGLQIENYETDRWMSFRFNIPQEGAYLLSFRSALAAGGALSEILVDGNSIAAYDFFCKDYIMDSGLKTLKTLYLTAGDHIFTLKAIDHTWPSWGYCMYPAELNIKKAERMPVLTEVIINAQTEVLVKGQSTKLNIKGKLDDGTIDGLIDSNIQLKSSDESVVKIDSAGYSITAMQPGIAVITAVVTLRDVTVEGSLSVYVTNETLKDITVEAENSMLIEGESCYLTIQGILTDGKAANLADADIIVTSENIEVASAIDNGIIVAVSEGIANFNVTVKLGDVTVSKTIAITVEKLKIYSVEPYFQDGITDIAAGKSKLLMLRGTLNNNTSADLAKEGVSIVYTSENPGIAAVDRITGMVTAISTGAAVINADVTLEGVTKRGSLMLNVFSWDNVKNKKTRNSLYTNEKIANARKNIELYDWAKNQRDTAVANADKYLEMGMDYWWNIITTQDLPRSYTVKDSMTCPICGVDLLQNYGNYPWVIDAVNHPWKLICPSCSSLFPSNDFGAYYNSGIDQNGNFDPDKADRSLLTNTLYPDKPADWGVDDGYGFNESADSKLLFIAYYNHWGIWYNGAVQKALDSLRDAYIYTGDVKYAKLGTVMLDRIADIYPSMDSSVFKWDDGFKNSHGGTGLGKILGSIWETILVPSFIRAYDAFFPAMDDQEIISFLQIKSQQFNMENTKTNVSAIRKNIEDGILRQVLPGVRNCQLEGNTGMEQSCIALAAVVFDCLPETKELIEFNFKQRDLYTSPRQVTGGDIWPILVEDVDRDGHGNEAAPGYNYIWLDQLRQVADVMDGYSLEGLDFQADLYKNPKFNKMFKAFYPLILSGRYTAQIGDSGGTGNAGIIVKLEDCIKGFEKTGDPVLAQLAYYLNHNSIEGIHGDIFTADPGKYANDIKAVIDTLGELKLESSNLTGYGFAALRDGENYIRNAGIVMNFSNMSIIKNDVDFKYFSGSGTMQFQAVTDGNEAAFSFAVPASDDYEIDIRTFKATSYGIYDIYIDDEKICTYDFFGSTGAGNLEIIGSKYLTAGNHVISFKGNGRNPSNSEAYKMGVIQLAVLDKAAQEIRNLSMEKGDTQRDAWLYYGYNGGHGHADTLNLGIHAFGMDLAPDMGYPEYADENPKRTEWENNTVSHNTVVVDRSKQSQQKVGDPIHFDDSENVKLIDVEAPHVYPQTDMYRRTTALIRVDDINSYTIDLFRVNGGNEHTFSFHGNEGTVTTEGLNLVKQEQGTYAGSDVQYKVRPDSVSGWGYMGSGFHYLNNVESDNNPGNTFSVDWKIDTKRNPLPYEQDVHLKMTMLGGATSVALADGEPPQTGGNPESLTFLLVQKKGIKINSLFTSILQPYKDSPFIESIESVPVKTADGLVSDESAVAVKVVLKSGRTDYIVNALDADQIYLVDNKFSFKGFLGVYAEKDGKYEWSYLCDGEFIYGYNTDIARLSGIVTDFTRDLSDDNHILVQVDQKVVNPEFLKGRYIYIDNQSIRNGSYRIESAEVTGEKQLKLNIGDTTLIGRYVDSKDFSKGFEYDIAAGNKFSVPLSCSNNIEYTKDSTPPVTVLSTDSTAKNGWYSSDVMVTLSSSEDLFCTEYRLDVSQNWSSYKGLVAVNKEGVNTIEFYSIDKAGNAEAIQQKVIQIDKTLPEFNLTVNGEILGDGSSIIDSMPLTFNVWDELSGLAEAKMTIDGTDYSVDTAEQAYVNIDLSGKTGSFTARIHIMDKAGNTLDTDFIIIVTTSISSIENLIARYVKEEKLSGPIEVQLTQCLAHARHQLEIGRPEQAVIHLQDFIKHLNNKVFDNSISKAARDILKSDVNWLIKNIL